MRLAFGALAPTLPPSGLIKNARRAAARAGKDAPLRPTPPMQDPREVRAEEPRLLGHNRTAYREH